MKETISFTQKVKEEITLKPFNNDRLRSLLAAFIKINGKLMIHNRIETIELETENAKIAKYLYEVINKIYGFQPRFEFKKAMKFERRITYCVLIEEKVGEILDDLEISFLEGKISKEMIKTPDLIGGYLAGAFLASGSCNSPASSNYHLEVAVDDENYAKWVSKLINRNKDIGFDSKVIKRRNNYVVYLKKSDQISNFLIYIGATSSCMEFENVRVDRDFANIGNRLENCDKANYNKTLSSSTTQLDNIAYIDKVLGINNLTNKKLSLLCQLKKENKDATMQELANLMSEKLDITVSKSNVNHLFRSLASKVESYKGEKK